MPREALIRTDDRAWTWHQDNRGRGLYVLRHDGEEVGTVSLIPGHIRNEAMLLDQIVDLINTDHTEVQ